MLMLILLVVAPVLIVSGKCPKGCNEPLLLYDDLRCKPIFATNTDCCPSQFDCSHIERDSNIKNKCHFHGKLYNLGEQIDNSETYGNCQVGCSCQNTNDGMKFECAVLDCPEWLRNPYEPGCHNRYELDECCRTGKVCPPFEHTCNAGGIIYKDGERFSHPNEKCTTCVCKKGFSSGECKKKKCITEVTNRKSIEKFCAPMYFEDSQCCPSDWICPEKSDKIIPVKTSPGHPDLKCKYGKQKLNIGDSFKKNNTGFGGLDTCECRIPPFVTCQHTY